LIVSVFLTSPYDHERICSGEATEILSLEKMSSGATAGVLNTFCRSFAMFGIAVIFPLLVLFHFKVKAKASDFLNKHIKGFRCSVLEVVSTAYYAFIDLQAS